MERISTKRDRTREAAAEDIQPVARRTPSESVVISPPNFQVAKLKIVGTAPLVMNKMSSENRKKIMAKQESGSRSNKGTKREPKNFDAIYKGAMHIAEKGGWYGIPASGLRTGLVDACRLVGFKMTIAKLSIFIEADGYDADDGTPLVKLTEGKPVRKDMPVKLSDGSTDILSRPFFPTWEAIVTLRWDADQFSAGDVVNLLSRVGGQVGVCAGRPNSKFSTGMGWGVFRVES